MKKWNFLKSNYIWSFTTYFTEGFPFSITRTVVPLFLRDMKVSLEGIGLTSLYGLPWVLKFLWSPQVDECATKRRWLLTMQFLIIVMMFVAAIFVPLSFGVQAIAIMFFIVAVISATHDIAIDGYYLAALDKDGQAKFVGYRVMAYRIAMMTAAGVIVTIGTVTKWYLAFITAGALMTLFFIYHLFFLREVEEYRKTFRSLFLGFLKLKKFIGLTVIALAIVGIRYLLKSDYYSSLETVLPFLKKIYFPHWAGMGLLLALVVVALMRKKIKSWLLKDPNSHYSQAFLSYVDREKIAVILAFIIMLRVGEWMLSTMLSPFIVDLGIKVHYGWLASLIGLPASIVGAMIGGWAIYKYGMKKVIWPFLLAQNLTNIVYMLLAFHLSNFTELNTGIDNPISMGISNLTLIAGVMGFDQFAGGLGTAVLMTYLMRLCIPKFKATHYAIGSGLMSVGGMFAGVASGMLAGWLGYGWTFGISFLISIPAMLMIPYLPYLNKKEAVA